MRSTLWCGPVPEIASWIHGTTAGTTLLMVTRQLRTGPLSSGRSQPASDATGTLAPPSMRMTRELPPSAYGAGGAGGAAPGAPTDPLSPLAPGVPSRPGAPATP